MVKYDLVSVGFLVEPAGSLTSTTESPEDTSPNSKLKPLTFGLEYRANMSDLVIKVSDPDSDFINDGLPSDTDASSSGGESRKGKINGGGKGSAVVLEKIGTLQRVDSSFSGKGRLNSRSTIRNRPSCRKSRSESTLLFDNINPNNNKNNSKAEFSGLKNNNPSSAYNLPNKSCDYYRQKFLQEGYLNQASDISDWVNYSDMKKTAGQKVVNKLAAQQKQLEDAEKQQRKKSSLGNKGSMSSGSTSDSENENRTFRIQFSQKDLVSMKKKPSRLEPITLYAIKHSD